MQTYFFIIRIQVDKPFKNEEINNWSLENNLKFVDQVVLYKKDKSFDLSFNVYIYK